MNLAEYPLFSGLSEQAVNELASTGKVRNLAKGETLFSHGEPVKNFYIVASGILKLYRINVDGKSKIIEILKAGQTICENEIMDSCKCHRMSAEAVEDVKIFEFPVNWLKESVKKHPDFALNLLSLIANKMYLAEIEMEHQATMSAPQLVACFLQRIAVLHDFDPKSFELPYSKTLIASRLGMEGETFSRTLAKLKDHGILVSGSHVAINDLDKIEQYLCDFCSIADDCSTHKAIAKKLS